MEGRVLSWTRVARPAAGFAAGRVVVLVLTADQARYALWEGEGEPRMDAAVRLREEPGGWTAA